MGLITGGNTLNLISSANLSALPAEKKVPDDLLTPEFLLKRRKTVLIGE
jgi:hypothetical protein